MTTEPEPQSPLSETEKRAALLAELEAERQRRIEAGKWSRGTLPKLMAVPQAGETLRAAQQRALYAHLAEHPDAPKNVSAYEWMQLEVVAPEPVVEAPAEQYTDHSDAVDVTPPRRQTSPPPPEPPLPQIEPPRNRALEAYQAEQRRFQRFTDDDWKPSEGALRYPRGRYGW
jgi:hypothetical protein